MKNKRKKFKEHQFKKRAGWRDYHHDKNRANGGESVQSNLLLLDAYKHDAIHLLFGDRTLDEIIEFLLRLQQKRNYEYYRYFYGD